jgi:hypothetical protein
MTTEAGIQDGDRDSILQNFHNTYTLGGAPSLKPPTVHSSETRNENCTLTDMQELDTSLLLGSVASYAWHLPSGVDCGQRIRSVLQIMDAIL